VLARHGATTNIANNQPTALADASKFWNVLLPFTVCQST